ncbi:dTDP-4-dehydrorhamnose reductase [Myxococcota bacterium]|nr:dTDP-4-dehydrorhamnose reductase [Myxococcota bacterium]
MSTRWIITGSGGQLGSALVSSLNASPVDRIIGSPDHRGLDIANPESVSRFFGDLSEPPDVVVNAAAYTHVDRCETEIDEATQVNAVAPGLLAAECRSIGAKLVHISTDYVFPGEAGRPYREDDPTGPRSTYGRTKLEGEERVLSKDSGFLVVRTSWVFGRGRNFIGAIIGQVQLRRNGEADGPLRVVDDQRGSPTYAADLAEGLRALVASGGGGLFHLSNAGEATWWDLARLCVDEAGAPELEIERLKTKDLDLPAPRPANSVLDCSKAAALGVVLRDWREGALEYLRSEASPMNVRSG